MSDSLQAPATPPPQPSGLQYALRIFLGCAVVLFVLDRLVHHNPLWALISVIIVTEPQLSAALQAFYSRVLNTLIGCSVGTLLLYLLGPAPVWVLLGITIAVFVCTQLIRVPGSWRVAPVTVAIVMTPTILSGGPSASLSTAIERTGEVLLGCVVALLITLAANWIHRAARRSAARV